MHYGYLKYAFWISEVYNLETMLVIEVSECGIHAHVFPYFFLNRSNKVYCFLPLI